MEKLTMRSKITVRWTTNPGDLGYDGRKTNWKTDDKGELMGIRRAANFNYELGQRVGQGTYRAVAYFHNGKQISLHDINDCISDSEYEKEFRQYS